MILAQCDFIVSLIDQEYYDRAWCSVEVIMAQILAKSYRLHQWYEYLPDVCDEALSDGGKLRKAPLDLEVVMAHKRLTFETDRPKVMFLERQSKLLG